MSKQKTALEKASDAGQWLLDRAGDAAEWTVEQKDKVWPDRDKVAAARSVKTILNAAHSDHKLDHFKMGKQDVATANIAAQQQHVHKLSDQFDASFNRFEPLPHAKSKNLAKWPWKEWGDDIGKNMKKAVRLAGLFVAGGSSEHGDKVVAENDVQAIHDQLKNDPKLKNDAIIQKYLVPVAFIKASLFVENAYSPGSPPFDSSALPMNVNANLWKHAFDAYNKAHPEAPINSHTIHQSMFTGNQHDARNITAGIIILSTINAAIDPNIQGPERWAIVSSIYANGDIALHGAKHGREAIMQGGKVSEVMKTRYSHHEAPHADLGDLKAPPQFIAKPKTREATVAHA